MPSCCSRGRCGPPPAAPPAPPSPPLPPVGTLVELSGLASARGKTLNGKWGIIRSGAASPGRVEVELFARTASDRVHRLRASATVALKPGNLTPLAADVAQKAGYPALEQYLKHQAFDIQDSLNEDFVPGKGETMYWKHGRQSGEMAREELCRVWLERITLPGFEPEVEDRRTLAAAMRAAGRATEAKGLLKECVEKVGEGDARRNGLLCELAVCCGEEGGLEEAVKVVGEVVVGGEDDEKAEEHFKKIKGEALMKLYVMCTGREDADAVKEKVLKMYLEVCPEEGWPMHDLGDLLCKKGEMEEGVKLYKMATEKGYQSAALEAELASALEKMDLEKEVGAKAKTSVVEELRSPNLSSG